MTARSRRTSAGSRRPTRAPADFPETLHVGGTLARALRYGENPHQKAAFYALDGARHRPVAGARAGAAGQGAVLQQPAGSGRGAADLRRVRRARRDDRQAQQPVRRGHLGQGRRGRLPARARDRSGVGVRRHRRRQPSRRRRAGARDQGDVPGVRDRAGLRARTRCRCSRRARTCACWSATSRPRAPGAFELRSVAGGFLVQTRDTRHGRGRGREGRVEAPADARRAARSRFRLARLQARQVERDRVRGRRPHAGHRRRPDVARRFGPHRGVEGARAAGRVGRRVGRVLPVPRRRRRGRRRRAPPP